MYVQGTAVEPIGRAARPDVLEEIARITKGKVIPSQNVDEIVRGLADLKDPPPMVRRVPLWSHPSPVRGICFTAGGLLGGP